MKPTIVGSVLIICFCTTGAIISWGGILASIRYRDPWALWLGIGGMIIGAAGIIIYAMRLDAAIKARRVDLR